MKPTAVRANKSDVNSNLSSNIVAAQIKMAVCTTPSKNHSLNTSPPTANSTQINSISSGATISTALTNITTTNSSTIGITPSQIQSNINRDESYSHANKTNSTRDQQPIQNNIIPTSAPAFAAVAKHSTSQHTANDGRFDAFNFFLFVHVHV